MKPTLRNKVGCLVNEALAAERVMWGLGGRWQDLKNRSEKLEPRGPTQRKCLWDDSSALTVCKVFPTVGTRLLRHALREWPIELEHSYQKPPSPDFSVLIATGGANRISQFQLSLRSVLAQKNASHEIVVVEQSQNPMLKELVPSTVTYEHQSCTSNGFNKSRAINRAARLAKGKWLCVHDADFLIPERYLASCKESLSTADGIRPARWIVHLAAETTTEVCTSGRLNEPLVVEQILQNTPNPMVFTKRAFDSVGRMDESFVGWGGEDLEFLSRLRTKEVNEAGFLPVVHLWHPAAEKKASGDRNQILQDARLAEPPSKRIKRLIESDCGSHV